MALLGSRRTTRQLDLTSQVSPWFRQSLGIPCLGCPSSNQHDHQFAPDDLPFGLLVYSNRQPWSAKLLVQEGSRAWDLTSAARLAFCFLTLVPISCPIGRNPHRRSNHRTVVGAFAPPNPHAGFAPSSEVAALRVFVTCLPSSPTRHRRFTLDNRRYPCAGRCPCLLSSDLYDLPIAITTHWSSLLAQMPWSI